MSRKIPYHFDPEKSAALDGNFSDLFSISRAVLRCAIFVIPIDSKRKLNSKDSISNEEFVTVNF